MQEKIFNAALAGLLQNLEGFARQAVEGGRGNEGDNVMEQLVPEQWRRGSAQARWKQTATLSRRLLSAERLSSDAQTPRFLQSIFCSVDGAQDQSGKLIAPPVKKYLPLKKLAIAEDTIFPIDAADDAGRAYVDLWSAFLDEAKALQSAYQKSDANDLGYLDSLLNLMKQYLWAIPAPGFTGVSLYDHSRMTAALAACLAQQDDADVQAWLNKEKQGKPLALLVGGDISGVQKFIYTITSQGASSGLRGRSMYLQLLTEVMARYLLAQFQLPQANLIYAGGGHFFMLLPPGSEEKLAAIQQRISRILLHHHQGDLYLALAWATVDATQTAGNSLRRQWDVMQEKLQKNKQRKFAELGADLNALLFAPQEHGGNDEKQCVVCKKEHPQTRMWPGEDKIKCPACHQFEELGKDLRKANYLTLDRISAAPLAPASEAPGDWQAVLSHVGYRAKLSQDLLPLPKDALELRTVLALNDVALKNLRPAAKQTTGRHFLVNVTPTLTPVEHAHFKDAVEDLTQLNPHNAPVKPFDIMARQSQGINRLGVLRMDVDNLGQILSQGFKGKKFSLPRIAALSFNFTLFFEGWVEQIAAEINRLGQAENAKRDGVNSDSALLYSIYSGGDDLFFVGAWDLMPLLAKKISADLKRFVAGHTGVHISGGIALIPGKYPLYQAAENAATAESAAKALRRSDSGEKNALNFLQQTIPWNKFEQVKEDQERLVLLVAPLDDSKAVPKSLLQKLLQLYNEFSDFQDKQEKAGKRAQVYWGSGQWRSAYSLSRMAARYPGERRQEIEAIRKELRLEKFGNIEWIGISARWAGLLTRKGEQND